MAESLQQAVPFAWRAENVNRQTSIILNFSFHLRVFAVCFVATIFLPLLCWDQLKNSKRATRESLSRGMMCSLGFQIMNLARPPESRESPTLTFSLVRHWPKKYSFADIAETQSFDSHFALQSPVSSAQYSPCKATVLVTPLLTLRNWTYEQ